MAPLLQTFGDKVRVAQARCVAEISSMCNALRVVQAAVKAAEEARVGGMPGDGKQQQGKTAPLDALARGSMGPAVADMGKHSQCCDVFG